PPPPLQGRPLRGGFLFRRFLPLSGAGLVGTSRPRTYGRSQGNRQLRGGNHETVLTVGTAQGLTDVMRAHPQNSLAVRTGEWGHGAVSVSCSRCGLSSHTKDVAASRRLLPRAELADE